LALTAALLLAGCSSSDTPPAPAASVTIEYIAHASFRVTGAEGTRLLVDPFASRVWLGYDFPPSYLAADAVVVTHQHYDHDYGEFIGNEVPWPGESATPVFREPADSRTFREFMLTGATGRHAGPYGDEFGKRNTVWVIEHAGLRFAHWGDNEALTPELQGALGRVDVLFLPIDGEEHILSNATVEDAIASLSPRVVIPMHYRHPDLESSASSPQDLGPIDPWLEGRSDVTRLGSNRLELSTDTLPADRQVLVFDHGLAP
jgi:L-ascorbate metabolism protein UlaG (beta-lactamase superfamily)